MAEMPTKSQSAPSGVLADILIKHVQPDIRDQLLNSLVEQLQPTDHANLELVTWLVVSSGNSELVEKLKNHIGAAVRAGELIGPISICRLYPDLAATLLESISVSIAHKKTSLGPQHLTEVRHYLSFCKSTLSRSQATDEIHTGIFLEGLSLLGSSNRDVSQTANQLVSSILTVPDERLHERIITPLGGRIWTKILELCDNPSADTTTLSMGYSLWLRLLCTGVHKLPKDIFTDNYWRLVMKGLRLGDAELRKICLAIVKLSTIDRPSISTELQHQYARYCTVFETIILSHYLNQVVECEADLDFLASKECQLTSEWLYVLLASAIGPTMQESNRKFIGSWVMKTTLVPNEHFFHFIKHDFLPWAILGPGYVSSLRRINGVLQCGHGDRLAEMVERISPSDPGPGTEGESNAHHLADIIIDVLSQKKKSVFGYAIVYLVKGMREWLTPEQKSSIADFPLHRLPEAARNAIISLLGGDIGVKKLSATASRRQELEKAALEKCATLAPDLASLNALWDNLQYLETPKDFLLRIPAAILSPEMVQAAVNDPELAASLTEKLKNLHSITENRAYLLAPLVIAVRKAFLACPAALGFLQVHQFIVRLAKHPPRQTTELLLEESAVTTAGFSYEKYFGERPSIGFAALLDLCSRLSGHQKFVKSVLNEVLHPWKNQKSQPPTVTVWKRALQLQIILLFCMQLDQTHEEASNLLQDLLQVLSVEPLPRYRYLLEWTCTYLCLNYNLQDKVITDLSTKDHHSIPKFLASLMKVGCILGCTPDASESFALRLATVFVPLAASSKVVIRQEAQFQFPTLMDHARTQDWESIAQNAVFLTLDDYIRSLDRFSEPPAERILARFDPSEESTLTNLVEGPWFALDHTMAPLTSRNDLLRLYALDEDDAEQYDPPSACLPLGEAIQHPEPTASTNDLTTNLPQIRPDISESQPQDPLLALQTKGKAYLSRALQFPSTSTFTSDPSLLPRSRPNVLVMASLVDNPYNLGGLSRVSEIFGAGALTLQNQNVITNRDFRAVSVSSHLHIPIVQLSALNVPGWLVERKEEGFTVVGIEQTDRSLVLGSSATTFLDAEEGKGGEVGELNGELHDGAGKADNNKAGCPLPEKVVLVVGSEREGIPARVLVECDILVEIPQIGITRSLNVQTAVAIVLYEHARQWASKTTQVA